MWSSEHMCNILYRSASNFVNFKKYSCYSSNDETDEDNTFHQMNEDFKIFKQNYQRYCLDLNEDVKEAISDYRGQWGERRIHELLAQPKTDEIDSKKAYNDLSLFRNHQTHIIEPYLFRGTQNDGFAKLTSTTTSLPVIMERMLYNRQTLMVIKCNGNAMGLPIYSNIRGMGNNKDCEILLCSEKKPIKVGEATRDRKNDTFEGHKEAVEVFRLCTEKSWRLRLVANRLCLYTFE